MTGNRSSFAFSRSSPLCPLCPLCPLSPLSPAHRSQ